MQFKNLISVATAVALGSTQVSAIQHGDVSVDANGHEIKYHQLAKGMWSGIPIEEWDDDLHKRSDFDHGLEKIETLEDRSMTLGSRSSELETRNFESFCQSVTTCFKEDGAIQLVGCMGIYIEAVGAAAQAAGTIWDLLNTKPFITTIAGGTISTIVGIRGEKTIWPPPAAECSTANNDKDAFASAIQAALSVHPGATSISTDVTGPEFSYTVTITVHENENPPPPVVGQCFNS